MALDGSRPQKRPGCRRSALQEAFACGRLEGLEVGVTTRAKPRRSPARRSRASERSGLSSACSVTANGRAAPYGSASRRWMTRRESHRSTSRSKTTVLIPSGSPTVAAIAEDHPAPGAAASRHQRRGGRCRRGLQRHPSAGARDTRRAGDSSDAGSASLCVMAARRGWRARGIVRPERALYGFCRGPVGRGRRTRTQSTRCRIRYHRSIMQAEKHTTPYEVLCHHCNVTFPVGTKRCVHCGGRLGRRGGGTAPGAGDSDTLRRGGGGRRRGGAEAIVLHAGRAALGAALRGNVPSTAPARVAEAWHAPAIGPGRRRPTDS